MTTKTWLVNVPLAPLLPAAAHQLPAPSCHLPTSSPQQPANYLIAQQHPSHLQLRHGAPCPTKSNKPGLSGCTQQGSQWRPDETNKQMTFKQHMWRCCRHASGADSPRLSVNDSSRQCHDRTDPISATQCRHRGRPPDPQPQPAAVTLHRPQCLLSPAAAHNTGARPQGPYAAE